MNMLRDWRVLTWAAICAALISVLAFGVLGSSSELQARSVPYSKSASLNIVSQLDYSMYSAVSAGSDATALQEWLTQVSELAAAGASLRANESTTPNDGLTQAFNAVRESAQAGLRQVVQENANVPAIRRETIAAITALELTVRGIYAQWEPTVISPGGVKQPELIPVPLPPSPGSNSWPFTKEKKS
jgi:hypothetical protein